MMVERFEIGGIGALFIWNTGMYFVLLPSVDLDLPHAIDYDVEDG